MKNIFLTTILVSLMIAGIPAIVYAAENTNAANMPENEMPSMGQVQNWDPTEEMEHLQRKIDRIFKESYSRAMKDEKMLMHGKNNLEVNMTVKETKNQFIVSADLPGLNKEDINIELKDHLLTISGQRKSEMKTENEKVIKEEQSFGSFSNSVTVPEDANTTAIAAEYKNGVLTVTMPRIEMAKKAEETSTKIPIK